MDCRLTFGARDVVLILNRRPMLYGNVLKFVMPGNLVLLCKSPKKLLVEAMGYIEAFNSIHASSGSLSNFVQSWLPLSWVD